MSKSELRVIVQEVSPEVGAIGQTRNVKLSTYIMHTILKSRGSGRGEAGEATASPEFRGFTTEKFLTF